MNILEELGISDTYSCVICGDPARFGATIRTYCAKHAGPEDILITHRIKCYKCDVTASYGLAPGKPEYCATHRPNNYWHVYVGLCGCGKVPHYGIYKRITCAECKLPDHKYLGGPLCECGKQASFGPKGGNKIACKDCKKKGYISLSSRKCIECGKENANYGLPNGPKLTCGKCKAPNHVPLYSAPKCEICGSRANFRLPGGKATRCAKCRTSDYYR